MLTQTSSGVSQVSGTETFTYDKPDRVASKQDVYDNVSRYQYGYNCNLSELNYGGSCLGGSRR